MYIEILQYIGGGVLAIGYLPQIYKVIRRKSVEDISLNAFLLIDFGVLLMQIYAIDLVFAQNVGHAFFITNSVGLFVTTVLVVVIVYYKYIKKNITKERDVIGEVFFPNGYLSCEKPEHKPKNPIGKKKEKSNKWGYALRGNGYGNFNTQKEAYDDYIQRWLLPKNREFLPTKEQLNFRWLYARRKNRKGVSENNG